MVIGVLKEIKANEYRVSAIPSTVAEILRRGHPVLVQASAGLGSGFSDAEYEAAGAEIVATADEVYRRATLFKRSKSSSRRSFRIWIGTRSSSPISTPTPTRRRPTPCFKAA